MADRVPKQSGRTTRPPVKRTRIERVLRERIITGKLAPGSVLPSRWELCRTFRTSIHTVQRAVGRLVEDQYLVSHAGEGTYVASAPPHLTQFALVIPHNPSDGYSVWSRFWQALTGEAERIGHESPPRKVLPFYGIYGVTDAEDYQRLLHLLRRQRLAGLIFASPPHWLQGASIPEFDVPKVGIMSVSSMHFPAVTPDTHSYISKVLDHFARRGRNRIGAIFTETGAAENAEAFIAAARARGMRVEPQWIQAVGLTRVEWVRNTALLLLSGRRPKDRPDGLLLADDNIVEPASIGVRDSGVRVGEELDIVAHCNFPMPPDSVVPVARLGYDVRHFLRICMQSIDDQRRGITPQMQTLVPAVFEEELSALQSLN
jgi:DNA-binding LacI/PurR family transcriptional regulator